MNLNQYMQNGIGCLINTAGRFYLNSKEGRKFLAGIAPQIKISANLRENFEEKGTHIPSFLIASVASQCNLHCAGCYARAGGACNEMNAAPDLSAADWSAIFTEAASLGISFILLAGGEPLTRRDVMITASKYSNLVFPIFTNGTMIDDDYLQLFRTHRNLVPIFSVEGNQAETDARRGAGIHAKIEAAMAHLAESNMLFGTSITVTNQNMDVVVREDFLSNLREKGCGIVIYVEYVPVQAGSEALALSSTEQAVLNQKCSAFKNRFNDMVLLSFPGDEAAMGGCLASGRGFFHINPKGGAEPCPSSPYPKYNLRDTSIKQVLESGYFEKLREIAAKAGPHIGGCVLFDREAEVRAL